MLKNVQIGGSQYHVQVYRRDGLAEVHKVGGRDWYTVKPSKTGKLTCSCPDYIYRSRHKRGGCKHCKAVRPLLKGGR